MFQVAWLLFIVTLFLAFEIVLMQGYNKLLFGKFEENFLIFLEGDIKTKINTLHSYYWKELAKTTNKKSGSSTNDNVESKWEYFNALTFLRAHILARSHFYVIPSKQERMVIL